MRQVFLQVGYLIEPLVARLTGVPSNVEVDHLVVASHLVSSFVGLTAFRTLKC